MCARRIYLIRQKRSKDIWNSLKKKSFNSSSSVTIPRILYFFLDTLYILTTSLKNMSSDLELSTKLKVSAPAAPFPNYFLCRFFTKIHVYYLCQTIRLEYLRKFHKWKMKIVEQRKENDTCNLTSCDSFYIRMVSGQSN